MPSFGSPTFEAYARTLRRVCWSDFLDGQLEQQQQQPIMRLTQQAGEPHMAVYPLRDPSQQR